MSLANYDITVRFYEFRNPLRLQCSQCLNGGQPACCDNPESNVSCANPCETGFRFMLRPYEAPVDTAPIRNEDFPYLTPATDSNRRIEFDTGSRAFLRLSNPFTLTSTDRWNVRYLNYMYLSLLRASTSRLAQCSTCLRY